MFTRMDVIFMNLFVQFRAIPFHICTLLTAMLLCSMPTQAGTVFYDFAAPFTQGLQVSATGFIETGGDPDGPLTVEGGNLNSALIQWSFTWFDGEEEFSVTSQQTELASFDGDAFLFFDESSDLVAWLLCTVRCGVKDTADQPHFFMTTSVAPSGGSGGLLWLGTNDILGTDCDGDGPLGFICNLVAGTGGQWTRRASVAAPEPAVAGLLALGLLAVGATKRRKC